MIVTNIRKEAFEVKRKSCNEINKKEENGMIKEFLKDESGMGTIEIVVIIAILIGLALIFRTAITKFVNNLMKDLWKTPDATGGMGSEY